MLYIVATPIGNLKDITLRALEVLKEADGVICEDSRRTSLLLNHYHIIKPFFVLNDYNEAKIIPRILQDLNDGKNLALVSDAGTPLISDPGYKLVKQCFNQGIKLDSIPGPSAVITALTLSGLPPDKFLFLGYLPQKPGHRKQLLEGVKINHLQVTYIIFISPHKLLKNLEEMKEIFGDIEVVLAHELTKIHQSVENNKISRFLEILNSPAGGPKGEYVMLFNLTTGST